MAAAIAAGLLPAPPPAEDGEIAGVRVRRARAPGTPRATVIHLHGGGFRIGSPEAIGVFADLLAKRCEVDVVCPAYRLAPEHPFPAGLTDAWSVFAALGAVGDRSLILSGDSAGGGLAAGVTALALGSQCAPIGLVLHSPWLDLSVAAPSYAHNAATDPLFSLASAIEAVELYLQGHAPDDPLASPLFHDVAGFPPTFISIGEGEVLADDSRSFHVALQAARVPSELIAIPDMQHVAVTRDQTLVGAAETFAAAADFIDRLLA